MQTKLEKISPQKAEDYLAQNFCNRPLSPLAVQRYVRIIQAGKFQITHQGVAFDEQGRLRDGQHRLRAIVESGTMVAMLVTRDLTEAAALAIDNGRKRTDAQALSMAHGSPISGFLAAIAKETYVGGNHFGTDRKPVYPDRLDLVDFYGEHMAAMRAIWEAFRDNTAGVGASFILAALVRARYHLAPAKVQRFAEVLASGYAGKGEEFIITFRNHILLKRREPKSRALRDELYAKTEQAVLDWCQGSKPFKIMKAKTELFPLAADRVVVVEEG